MGAQQSEGAAGQVQGTPETVRGAVVGRVPEAQRDQRDLHSARPAPRRPRARGREPQEGLWRQAADRRPELPAAARRHRRRDRGERRRQDHLLPHDHGRRAAGRRHAAPWRYRTGCRRRPVA